MKWTTLSEYSPDVAFIRAALDDLKTYGINRLSLQRVNEKSQAPEQISSTQSLLLELVKVGFHELTARIKAATPHHEPFREKLFQTCKIYLRMTSDHPELIKLMFESKKHLDPGLEAEVKKASYATFAAIESIMKEAISNNQLKSTSSLNTTLATWSFIHGCAFHMLKSGKNLEDHPEEVSETFAKLHSLLSKDLVSDRPN